MNEPNPVVLLSDNVWHIVEHSRRSEYALCGKRLAQRQAHSRLNTVGHDHICRKCWQLHATTNEAPPVD
ncbi:MAG: hypothetical protein R3E31_05145 [Chloroflexota bacterium]|nr:hypothetical protein [Anaerolineales bacterium]MCA9975545.1 hypothetical protein [Anaerolineales bacterium]MCB8966379.1 hypothetical protein [Ardenticatenaceae bacterium]